MPKFDDLIKLFAALVIICFAVLFWMLRNVRETSDYAVALEEESKKSILQTLKIMSVQLAEVRRQVEALNAEVRALRSGQSVEPPAQPETEKHRPDVSVLKPGLYVTEADIEIHQLRQKGSYTEKFTIYHLNTPIQSGADVWRINIGVATAGMTTAPQFYIDYDTDGKVDANMMYEYVSLIPYGGLLSKNMSENNSQAVYDAFLVRMAEAKFSPLDSITNEGGRVAKGLWAFVRNQAGSIASFIKSSEAGQANSGQPAPTVPPRTPAPVE